MLAGLAPAAGAALVEPVAAAGATALPSATTASAAAAERPELLTLGVELDAKQAAYRAALARPEEARAVAAELWPKPPASIVITSAADRRALWLLRAGGRLWATHVQRAQVRLPPTAPCRGP
jgi:hypothetical protein